MRRFRDPFKLNEFLIRKATKKVAKQETDKIKRHIESISEARDRARESLQRYIDQRN